MSTGAKDPVPGAPHSPKPASRSRHIKSGRASITQDLIHNAVIVVVLIALFVALTQGWLSFAR